MVLLGSKTLSPLSCIEEETSRDKLRHVIHTISESTLMHNGVMLDGYCWLAVEGFKLMEVHELTRTSLGQVGLPIKATRALLISMSKLVTMS